MHQIKSSILRIILFFYTSHSWCQVSFFGDIYVGQNKEFHIAFKETYFNQGKIKTYRQEPPGVVSFGSESQWTQLDEKSYIDGIVRVYHEGIFTFPIGDFDTFSPITFYMTGNKNYVQVQYNQTLNRIFFYNSMQFQIPQVHFWTWSVTGNPYAKIQTFWWPEHKLSNLIHFKKDINALNLGLLLLENWEQYATSLISNSFTPEIPLSLEYGSSIGSEPIALNKYTALTYLINKNETREEKLVSQVITPNNDAINDTWKIQGYSFTLFSEIKVYDLQQDLVFSNIGAYHNDWDGTASQSGKPLPDGSYFYTLELNGTPPIEKSGWIYIKRQ
jgi:gliding motility-associated-like protein